MSEFPSPQAAARLQMGVSLLQRSRAGDAADVFRALVAETPAWPDAQRLLGLALRQMGDDIGAEIALHLALDLDPTSGPTAYSLCDLLLTQGRGEEALAVIAPAATRAGADTHLLTAHGQALKGLGRLEEARGAYAAAAAAAPQSTVAEHNLASILGDLEHFAESEAAARDALKKGLDAPETWLVLARALLGQGRNTEAESAYRAVVSRRANDVGAHGELAQLIWMLTEDASLASVDLDRAIAAFPEVQALRLKKAELLQTAGELDAAYEVVAPVVASGDAEPMLHVIAGRLSLWRDPPRALRHALEAVRLIPDNAVAQGTLCEAYFATGEPEAGARIAAKMHEDAPLDQHSLGLLATAWRLLADPRYERLYDYGTFVRTWRIDTPEGWPSLDAYLADLEISLGKLHTLRTHPVGQSVRHGSQTSQRLTLSTDPTIQAFFRAVDGPIRRHIAALGAGDDPLRSRISNDYKLNGEWSVRLREAGYHAGHLHPRGWLSSACYIALPSAVGGGDREGWLQFGEPGVPTAPALKPQHFIKPEPGLLALFPSYMWHGTAPFHGDEARLTIAFDVVPA